MSKKLIAVAAAAALALTGLVAAPANSAVGAWSLSVTGAVSGNGLTSDSAYLVNIPTQDVLRFHDVNGVSVSVFRVTTTAPGTTDTVRAVATGGVKVLTNAAFTAATTRDSKLGVADVSQASVDGNATFYVYSTSTANGTVTFSSGANSSIINVKGTKPAPYNVALKSSVVTVANGSDTKVDLTVTDAFGNAIEETLSTGVSITKVGPVSLSNPASITWDADRKTMTTTVAGTASGQASVAITLGATKIDTLGTPKDVFFTVTVGGTAAEQVTALTAQVAALTAQLAESRPKATSVTKKKYNTLARKWNAAFPSQRVALKK